jgi:hypothetical protein
LFVDASGNVGVGVASPAPGGQGIHSHNSSAADSSLRLTNSATGATNGDGFAIQVASDGTAKLRQFENLAITFETNGTERMRLDSSGRLGLGTSSPGGLLHVDQATAGSNVLRLTGNYSTSGTSPLIVFERSGGAVAGHLRYNDAFNAMQIGTTSAHRFDLYTNSSTALTIDSSQRVGIGTASPATALAVNGNITLADSGTGASFLTTVKGGNSIYFGVDNSTGSVFGSGTAYSPIIYTGAAAPITFSNSSAERARIDSSGRLLVGTSSARSNWFNTSYTPQLQLEGISGAGSTISICANTNDNGGSYLVFGKTRGTTVGANTVVASDDSLGQVVFQGSDGTELVTAATITGAVDGTPGANDMPGRLVFSTTADGAASPTERMRITNTGAVLINTTTTATNALFEVSSNGTKKSFQVYNNDNVQLYSLGTGTVYSNGGVLTNTNPSDERLKDSIETLGWGLEEVMALRPVSFDWKNNRTNQGRQYGFIAQEVQSVMPELVTEFETVDGDETVTRLGLEKDGIYAALVKAIQEQQTMIADLQAKVAALEAS